MKLKSYFSGTVEAAMELARKEMGDDALLVHVRPSTPETRRFGAFEVVFGIPPGNSRLDALALPSAGALAAGVKREKQPPAVNPPANLPAGGGPLLAPELDAGLARPVAEGAALDDLFAVDATLGQGGERAVVALVGPPGAGKTTTLVKLAAATGWPRGGRCTFCRPTFIASRPPTRSSRSPPFSESAAPLRKRRRLCGRRWRSIPPGNCY